MLRCSHINCLPFCAHAHTRLPFLFLTRFSQPISTSNDFPLCVHKIIQLYFHYLSFRLTIFCCLSFCYVGWFSKILFCLRSCSISFYIQFLMCDATQEIANMYTIIQSHSILSLSIRHRGKRNVCSKIEKRWQNLHIQGEPNTKWKKILYAWKSIINKIRFLWWSEFWMRSFFIHLDHLVYTNLSPNSYILIQSVQSTHSSFFCYFCSLVHYCYYLRYLLCIIELALCMSVVVSFVFCSNWYTDLHCFFIQLLPLLLCLLVLLASTLCSIKR